MVVDGQGARGESDALSIAELYEDITAALALAFPRAREVWVRGEVQKCTESRGHAYIDLVDPDQSAGRTPPVLKVKCWQSTWRVIKAELAANGIELASGMTVVLRGHLDLYTPRAEIGFILEQVDVTALLGRLAQERAALIEALRADGLLDAQRRLPSPRVPISVGLVGSPGTEGFSDFLEQLEQSGYSFRVHVARASVQGERAPTEVAVGIAALLRTRCDVICVVRGGGSKTDLAAFDRPEIARAIAMCPIPVWTGVGHTGDESVADVVANVSHITPTACGQAVVQAVDGYFSHVVESARRVEVAARAQCASKEATYTRVRQQLIREARAQLLHHEGGVAKRRRELVTGPQVALARAHGHLTARAGRLGPLPLVHLARAAASNAARRSLLAAYDPSRLLARGWSLTTTLDGTLVRSTHQLRTDTIIVTRLADGVARSTVLEIDTPEVNGPAPEEGVTDE